MDKDLENWLYRPIYPEEEFFKKVEAALGFKLFIWQKAFIVTGVFRQYGETTAEILRELLETKAEPLDYTRPPENVRARFYRDELKVDFDLGDRITCKEEKWGIQIDARITEVKEIYQKGTEEIEATFGESLPTLVDKIRKVR